MTHLSLYLLGPARVKLDEVIIEVKPRKALALLIYLAVTGERYPRDSLATLLWPQSDQRRARHSLRSRLSELNQILGNDWLEADRESVGLRTGCWLDVSEFQQIVADKAGDPESLMVAADLYRDDFLTGFSLADCLQFDEWQFFQSESLRQSLAFALEKLIVKLGEQREYQTAVPYARRWLALDPLHEAAHRQLMQLYAQMGQQAAALRQYEQCRQTLEDELGISPSSETRVLYQDIQAGKVTGRKRKPLPRHNLPVQTTTFIGREAELADIKRLLLEEPGCRLLNLVGPGGIGKTRLALATAGQLLDAFPDGTYFVSLASVAEAEDIVPAMAAALNFTFYGATEPKEQLLDYLRSKKLLIVADNFEHLLDGSHLLTEIISQAPDVYLMVTSRERLNLQEEWGYDVRGLLFPASSNQTSEVSETSEALEEYSSLKLFLQRARRAKASFTPSVEETAAIIRICQLVDGMPLGLELAAPWVRTLSCREIADEIARNLDFLTTSLRNIPERHRSLRVVFEQTWERLSPDEQAVLQQLSVFRGGCTRQAAEQVTGATLPILASLVDKALVRRTNIGRYELHDLISQFAAEKLAQDEAMKTAVRDSHSTYYCAFLHAHTEHWYTARQLETLAAVTHESDNVEQTWRRALAKGEWQLLRQAIDSLVAFYDWWGRFADAKSFCQSVVEEAERQAKRIDVSPHCLRLWVRALAELAWFTADNSEVRHRLQQSLALLERPELVGKDTRPEKALVLYLEGGYLANQNLREARQVIEQSLALYHELGDQLGIAKTLRALGYVDWRAGNHDSALTRVQAALTIHLERGDHRGQAICMTTMGRIHKTQGHLEEAEHWAREALRLSQQIGDQSLLVRRYTNLAHTLLFQGKLTEAQQLAEKGLAICRDLDHRAVEGWVQYCLCETLMHSGQYQPAARQAVDGLLVVQAVGDRRFEAAIYGVMGQLALAASSYTEARAAFAKSAEIFRKVQYGHIDISLAGLGYTACCLDRPQEARQHLLEALRSALDAKTYGPILFALPGVALLFAEAGKPEQAVTLYALASKHDFVANSRWFQDVVGCQMTAVAEILPPKMVAEAQTRGQERDLWTTARELLAELEGA